MLYRTHHPFFFHFHPISSVTSHLTNSPYQFQAQMECVEAALKTSIRKEMDLKTATTATQQLLFDDFLSANNVPNGASDDFFVDDLFNFSNEDSFLEEEEEDNNNKTNQHQEQQHSTLPINNNVCEDKSFALEYEFGCLPLPTNELCLPAEDLESLEWLSHFVEDSFASFPAAGDLPVKAELPPFKTPVPAKARSKRARTCGRVWTLGSPMLTESSSSSSSSLSSLSAHSPTSHLLLVSPVEKPRLKKPRKKLAAQPSPVQPRRCSHCGVQKTPQWRTGPFGAKTLCNACGVRYKSGRLLPEYRPACSPTFSSELHSNHHRKVLEMRKKKDMETVVEAQDAAAPPAMPSFEK